MTYEEVKDLSNYPEKLLIDVREPTELVADGKIPFSINIPCKLSQTACRDFKTFFLVKQVEENLKLSPEVFHNKFGREKPTNETEMVFHCKGGGRAGRATELALSLGFVK